MLKTSIYNFDNPLDKKRKDELVQFLYTHLEQYGDSFKSIERAVDYSLVDKDYAGGFALTGHQNGKMVGAVVMNRTGMKGYIPENVLVYIATHKDYRGQGIGKALLKTSIEAADGAVALHVEPDNPALHLYRKSGFTNKYLEMRLEK